MKILMSIQSKYARKIFAGKKHWEYRRSIPKQACDSMFPVSIVVYSSGEDRAIIGEFRVGQALNLGFKDLMDATGTASDAEAVEWLGKYYKGCKQCGALEVAEYRLYEEPIPLSVLQERLPGFRPPQSFQYIEPGSQLEETLNI